ncbi:MAG: alpha/beta fold hydrolase [Rhizobiales bacterium]|nr:alpha/beta fold hydrolase [Hyphomicrobiales bacterium]
MTALGKFALVFLIGYAGVMLVMYLFQRSLQYHPENKGLTPQAVGLSGVEVNLLDTPDGERIVTWYAAAKPGRPTIIYFHGNAGEIGDRPKRFQYYAGRGFGVLYVSYRGFGGSTGQISERGFLADAIASYEWLVAQGVAPAQIAVLGESLGTGVAVQLAAQKPVGAIALEAPYTSTADIAAPIYWWLPVRLLMKDQFRSIDYIGAVTVPLLVIHGETDTLIPVEYGKALFAAANEPKEIALIAGFGHEVLFEEATWARELEFFDRVITHTPAVE